MYAIAETGLSGKKNQYDVLGRGCFEIRPARTTRHSKIKQEHGRLWLLGKRRGHVERR